MHGSRLSIDLAFRPALLAAANIPLLLPVILNPAAIILQPNPSQLSRIHPCHGQRTAAEYRKYPSSYLELPKCSLLICLLIDRDVIELLKSLIKDAEHKHGQIQLNRCVQSIVLEQEC